VVAGIALDAALSSFGLDLTATALPSGPSATTPVDVSYVSITLLPTIGYEFETFTTYAGVGPALFVFEIEEDVVGGFDDSDVGVGFDTRVGAQVPILENAFISLEYRMTWFEADFEFTLVDAEADTLGHHGLVGFGFRF
jgi:opacity protein-like surface antigen